MKVPLVFGKRDQKKYKDVIEWLEEIEDGWRNTEVKEALYLYVQMKKNGSLLEGSQKMTTSTSHIKQDNMRLINENKIEEENYKEINSKQRQEVQYNENNKDSLLNEEILTGIDKFSDDSF